MTYIITSEGTIRKIEDLLREKEMELKRNTIFRMFRKKRIKEIGDCLESWWKDLDDFYPMYTSVRDISLIKDLVNNHFLEKKWRTAVVNSPIYSY